MNTDKEAIEWVAGFFANELIGNIQASVLMAGYSCDEVDETLALAAKYIADRQNPVYYKAMRKTHWDVIRKGLV